MATWGTTWGLALSWGDPSSVEAACELAQDRLLAQHPDEIKQVGDGSVMARPLRDWICKFAEQSGAFRHVLEQVRDGFQIETAIGVQLDAIGSLIGLPRSGFGDVRYRVMLGIQAELLLAHTAEGGNWTGTTNNILTIVRRFIGETPGAPIVLTQTPPYAFTLQIPAVFTVEEFRVLRRFICLALYAGVLGVTTFPTDDSVYGSEHGAVVDAGIYGSAHGAVAEAALYDHVEAIGADDC